MKFAQNKISLSMDEEFRHIRCRYCAGSTKCAVVSFEEDAPSQVLSAA